MKGMVSSPFFRDRQDDPIRGLPKCCRYDVYSGKVAIWRFPAIYQPRRRIKEAVREELHVPAEILALSGPANSYAGHVTTREV